MKIPYYVAASFNADTLPGPRKVRIGDGSVIGGYLNYPLVKGKNIIMKFTRSGSSMVNQLL
ncbi:hypothetical protein WUBG_18518 [Wuchereria bancrofti]|uniref:Uncharacterized protein n=2 Tax=Wuchereria bancrofti TaxID=6293 RepID=J9DMA4_WUCBA|nr:hypothetical protein WUBG_18518 [Wuchereria bancrofti]